MYHVVTTTCRVEDDRPPVRAEARRRFSEFLELHNALKAVAPVALKAAALPALPSKHTFGRLRSVVVTSRREGLQAYLQRLAMSAELLRRPEVNIFLGVRVGTRMGSALRRTSSDGGSPPATRDAGN